MQIRKTEIDGLVEILPAVYQDDRGYFLETFHAKKFREAGIPYQFAQSNQSYSVKGVLRGLHFQKEPFQQGKLVKVATGKVLDVAVDLRKTSSTFGQYVKVVLDSKLNNMVYVPEGFAHGFLALEDAVFTYMCTNIYNKSSESGIIWDDPEVDVDWGLEKYGIKQPLISEKDLELLTLEQIKDQLSGE